MNDQRSGSASPAGGDTHEAARPDDMNAGSPSTPFRDPAHWKTGGEPITAAQKSYLSTLATEAGESAEDLDSLTKAEAAERIDALQQKTGRGK